jgi:hypothetical protein
MPFLITTTFPEEDAAGIGVALKERGQGTDGLLFNLSGQRMVNPSKGIVIKGGKKYIK